QQVQGAAPNHALTEYYLSIFQIELTLAGYLFLRQRVKDDERLVWFSIADIENGATADGKIPYIKALYDDFAGDKAALAAALSALPASFSPAYLVDKNDFAISLPSCAEQAVLTWKLGKDKPLNQSLNQRQLALVLGLAAHLRGFELMPDAGLILHPHGWIEIDSADSLALELQALAADLRDSELRVESYLDRWFRLSINPATVFFADRLFRVLVSADDLASCTKSKIPLTIERQGFATALGWALPRAEVFKLTLDFVSDVMKLADQPKPDADDQAVRIDDAYKKGLHKKTAFSELGLRRLIRREDGEIKVVLAFVKT
ncbi:MAG: NUDIX hydrolase, partial [Methylomonas sp.]